MTGHEHEGIRDALRTYDAKRLVTQLSGLSGRSLDNVILETKRYFTYLQTLNLHPLAATPATITDYAATLTGTHTPRSLVNALSAVRGLYKKLRLHGVIQAQHDPTLDLSRPNPATPPRPHYPEADLARLQAHGGDELQLPLELALCGLRPLEMINLCYEDLDPMRAAALTPSGEMRLSPRAEQLIDAQSAGHGGRLYASGHLLAAREHQVLRRWLWNGCRDANVTYRGYEGLHTSFALRVLRETGDVQQRLRLLRLQHPLALQRYEHYAKNLI